LNSASNYFPRNGDTVYIEFQAGGNQLYSQAFTLSATSDIFTASGVAYNTSTHLLSFHAASFIGGLGSTSVGSAIHIAGISSCNYYPCGSTNTEFYCGDNSTILTDPIDYSCTLNSNSNYRPNYGDTVYLEFQTPGDQWYSQAFTLTAPNNPPVINQLSNQSINEGATYSASGSFTDTDSTSWTGTVDYGDGGGTQTLTLSGTNFTLNHTYTTAGTFTVTVSVTDNQGATGTGTATVTVNAPPQVNSFSGGTINEGGTYTSNGSFTDSDSTSWTATVDYGDGGGANALTLNSDKTFSLSHVYKDNGTYTVTVSVTNNQGATGTGTATVTTNNVVPTVGTITAPSSPVIVNTSITASANFTDPGVLDTHTASWNWGDGNTTTGTVTESNGSGSVSNSHTYTATGVYMITLTVTDKDGGQGTSTFPFVAVYDSTSSFAGGRSYDNPSSASPNMSGKVSFGISAKYNNSNVLTGSAKMDFKAASPSLDFASTSLSSLATSNGKAYLKGSGTLNGTSGYTFLATGIDGSVAGGNDLIRFQIKQGTTTIYDSQPGAGDTADPTTTDATGNIRVH